MKLRDLLGVLVYHQNITITKFGLELYKGISGHASTDELIEPYLNDDVLIISTIVRFQIDIDIKSKCK